MSRNTLATPTHIIERNRANAQLSTGPRSDAGKAVSRRNALKHGLCANPAAGVVEDRTHFEELHAALVERFQPRDAVEDALVHRIAVSLWRLQRAARIDSAAATLGAHAVSPARHRAQKWIERIRESFWALDWVEVTDRDLIEERIRQGLLRRGRKWHRLERRFLAYADRLRDETMMEDGAAITAMMVMIERLIRQLEAREWLGPVEAQMLAWLMGESAERLMPKDDDPDQRAMYYPDEKRFASPIDTLIGEARKRPEGEPMPEALLGAVEARLTTLRAQRTLVADPYTTEQDPAKQTATLLPDAPTLERLLRYESHAERSLQRSLDLLAKLRGATVETIAATITGPGPHGSRVELRGERTQWQAQG